MYRKMDYDFSLAKSECLCVCVRVCVCALGKASLRVSSQPGRKESGGL